MFIHIKTREFEFFYEPINLLCGKKQNTKNKQTEKQVGTP